MNFSEVILINHENKKVALVYNDIDDNYTFILEKIKENETPLDCAVRSTKEQAKRVSEVLYGLKNNEYTTRFLMRDLGEAVKYNPSKEIIWVDEDLVESKLADYCKGLWQESKEVVSAYLNDLVPGRL